MLLQRILDCDNSAFVELPGSLSKYSVEDAEKILDACISLATVENTNAVEALAEVTKMGGDFGLIAAHGLVRCARKGHEVALDIVSTLIRQADVAGRGELVRGVAEGAKRGSEKAIKAVKSEWAFLTDEDQVIALDGLIGAALRGNNTAVSIMTEKWLDVTLEDKVRTTAGEGLVKAAERGHDGALCALLEQAEDSSEIVGKMALLGVAGAASRKGDARAMEIIHKRLGSSDPQMKLLAEEALGAAAFEGHPHVIALLAAELDRKDGFHVVAAATLAVGAREGFEEAIAALGSRVTKLSDAARLEAVKGLAGAAAGTNEGGSERAIDVLFGLITDPNENIRFVVMDGLAAAAGRGNDPAAQVLLGELKNTNLPENCRVSIVKGLCSAAENGNDRVVETLFQLMDDSCEAVRAYAHQGMQGAIDRNSAVAIQLTINNVAEIDIPETIEE